jgi:hypothetical protein
MGNVIKEQANRQCSITNASGFKRLPVKYPHRPEASTQDPLLRYLAGRMESAPKSDKKLASKS